MTCSSLNVICFVCPRRIHRSPQGATWAAWLHLCSFLTLISDAEQKADLLVRLHSSWQTAQTRGHIGFPWDVFLVLLRLCSFVGLTQTLTPVGLSQGVILWPSHITNTVYFNIINILKYQISFINMLYRVSLYTVRLLFSVYRFCTTFLWLLVII